MSMWEIDELLKSSITLVQESDLSDSEKRNVTWNLENLAEKHEMDAGGFSKIENDDSSKYDDISPFKLGEITSTLASDKNQTDFIYDWSAFLLNFYGEYFSKFSTNDQSSDDQSKGELMKIKALYHKYDFSNYEPKHATLTIYKDGNNYFSEEQNQLIKWFFE